jgi:hypothetical protein
VITDIILVIAAALFIGVYVSWRAGRIDRLHARVDMARAALDVTLLRRSSVSLELATSGLLDPATSLLLAGAVHGTRGGDRPRDLAESDLTRALRAAFSQPGFRSSLSGKEGSDELLTEVEEAAHQVFLARKFYNDVVAVTRDARGRPLARVLRLSGKAEAPVFFEMDDSLIAETSRASLIPRRAEPAEPAAPAAGNSPDDLPASRPYDRAQGALAEDRLASMGRLCPCKRPVPVSAARTAPSI